MRCRAFLRFDASGEPPLVLFKSAKLTQSFFRVCSCGGLRSLVHGRCGQKDPRKYRARPVRAWRILGVRRTLRRLSCGVVSHRRRGRSGLPQTPSARVWGQRLGQPEEDGMRKRKEDRNDEASRVAYRRVRLCGLPCNDARWLQPEHCIHSRNAQSYSFVAHDRQGQHTARRYRRRCPVLCFDEFEQCSIGPRC